MMDKEFSLKGGKTDILKFVLCILIVVLHTADLGNVLSPLLRCAVPLFFMVSAYFFFTKYDTAEKEEEKVGILKRFVKRNLQLYLFWFVLLLPFTIVLRKWYIGGAEDIVLSVCRLFLFSSTFPASWYIMATIIGVCLIVLLGRYINYKVLFVFSLLAYIFCCASSNYGNLINEGQLGLIYDRYVEIFTSPYNSFPVALIWLQLGRMIANKQKKLNNLNTNIILIALLISAILLCVEFVLIKNFKLAYADDCYLMLLPVCLLIILFFGSMKIELSPKPFLRKTSTIVFCCHLTIGRVFQFVLEQCGLQCGLPVFLITLVLSLLISYFIVRLEGKYKILKYAY